MPRSARTFSWRHLRPQTECGICALAGNITVQGSASPYVFSFGADDGGLLFINGSQLIDNHGEPCLRAILCAHRVKSGNTGYASPHVVSPGL